MKTPSITLRALTVSMLAALSISSMQAATLTLNPTADSGIRSDQPTNTGNSNIFIVGDTSNGARLRSLLSFDLNTPELIGATINSVTLTLTINDGSEGDGGTDSAVGTVTLDLHQLDSAFSETTTNWNTSDGSTAWTAGGAYSTLLSSTTGDANAARAGDTYVFANSSALLNAATSVSGTSTLDLLLKLSTENSTRNIFRFTSRNPNSVPSSYMPVLTIDYTAAAIPEPSAFALLGGLAALGLVATRRRR